MIVTGLYCRDAWRLQCTDEQVTAARSQGLCSSDDSSDNNNADRNAAVEYCATDLALGKTRAAVHALVAESVLCVAVDNNEVAGEYFATAPEAAMTVASAFRANPKPFSFISSMLEESSTPVGLIDLSTSTTSTTTAYSLGDSIRTFTLAADMKPIHAPVLSGFGAAVGSNECSELTAVRFAFAQAVVSCTRKAVALESACSDPTGALTAAPFVHNVLVAKRPNVTSSATAADVLVVEVDVDEFDFGSDTSTPLTSPLPSYVHTPEFAQSTSVCHGVLLRLEYVVVHDARGQLEHVRAKVTVGNVSSASATSVDIAQSFAVTFESASALPSGVVSLATGNVLQYQRSGNPGYELHFPVRVGVVATQSTSGVSVVAEMAGGLQVPGLGACSASAAVDQPVGFGEDSQMSCSLALTLDALRALCTGEEPVLPPLRVNFTRVAMFGNADPLLLDQDWLTLDYDAPTRNTATFTDALDPGAVELTCRDVITAVTFEFLVAHVGSVANPQPKIIAARAFHSKETWTFRRSTSATAQQTFLLRTTVSFVVVHATALEQLIPPAPSIWFSIPNDVFYPFVLNDGATASARPSWVLLSLLWIITAFVFQL